MRSPRACSARRRPVKAAFALAGGACGDTHRPVQSLPLPMPKLARAAYFPVFDLAAAAGFDSQNTSTWLNAPSRTWSVGPLGLLTVFDAGRHRAQPNRRMHSTMSR